MLFIYLKAVKDIFGLDNVKLSQMYQNDIFLI